MRVRMGATRSQRDTGLTGAEARAPLGRHLARDFHRTEDEQLESAARERNRALDHVANFFLFAHLACAAALALGLGTSTSLAVAAPVTLMLGLDLTGWIWLRKRPVSSLAPHVATRGAAGYTLIANLLWGAAAPQSRLEIGRAHV